MPQAGEPDGKATAMLEQKKTMQTTPRGSQPAARQVEAAMGISTLRVAALDMKVVMTVVTMAKTKRTMMLLGLPPRMVRMKLPMIAPAPESPKALAMTSTPAAIQMASWVIAPTVSLTLIALVTSRTMTPMAGMTYIRLPIWVPKNRESMTMTKTT